MKKDAFTLIELLAVIFILGLMVTMITIKVTKNIKKAENLATTHQKSMIESAAILYATDYSEELTNLTTKNVDKVTLSTLVTAGLLTESSIEGITLSNEVFIAKIGDELKSKYDPTSSNAIFINSLDEISISVGSTYTDAGAYIAIPGTGVSLLTSGNITSTVNTSTIGNYTVTYTYTNATTVVRKVEVL